jgi:hypothetical protein
MALLDHVDKDLRRLYAGTRPELPLVRALDGLVWRGVPLAEFRLLIEANRYDQTKTRYETFDELLDYRALSSQPLGRIVLRLFDATAPHRMSLVLSERIWRIPSLLAESRSSWRTVVGHLQGVTRRHRHRWTTKRGSVSQLRPERTVARVFRPLEPFGVRTYFRDSLRVSGPTVRVSVGYTTMTASRCAWRDGPEKVGLEVVRLCSIPGGGTGWRFVVSVVGSRRGCRSSRACRWDQECWACVGRWLPGHRGCCLPGR